MAVKMDRAMRIHAPAGQSPDETLRDVLTDARHYAALHALDFDAADRTASIHFDVEVREDVEGVHMIGVCVEYVNEPVEQPHPRAKGYVAHALLSDGTKSWPMGARVYDSSGPAEREALMIRWRNGGPQIERED